jgi:putative SOS response-associated peptidase YedK
LPSLLAGSCAALRAESTRIEIVACLWSHSAGKDEPEMDSFAAITYEPPAEIAETGTRALHDFSQPGNVEDWLAPPNVPRARLEAILSERKSYSRKNFGMQS